LLRLSQLTGGFLSGGDEPTPKCVSKAKLEALSDIIESLGNEKLVIIARFTAEITAIILYHHPLNCYYSTSYTGNNNPPDCGSFDGVSGIGILGGNCKMCPLNQYGTGENGSKACKNRRRFYLLREGEMFPMLLSLPTGSLKAFTKYLQSLLSKGRGSNSIVTRFSLKKATNTGGIVYSQCNFAFDRVLTPDEQRAVQAMSEQVKSFAGKVGFDTENTDNRVIVNAETGEIIVDGDTPF
jgi:hypothetical protein